MLIDRQKSLFIYSITRDLGFAPNPFHGVCTLATCKPRIRKKAVVGDWIMGIGGANMKEQKRKCIFLMEVTSKMAFDEYFESSDFLLKKPIRNGSRVRVLGDNIYHKSKDGSWIQEDSHHSNPDGTPNLKNQKTDAESTDQVLVSKNFFYFGTEAKEIDLDSIGHHNRIRDYQRYLFHNNKFAYDEISRFTKKYSSARNLLQGDPVHFNLFDKRVDQQSGQYV